MRYLALIFVILGIVTSSGLRAADDSTTINASIYVYSDLSISADDIGFDPVSTNNVDGSEATTTLNITYDEQYDTNGYTDFDITIPSSVALYSASPEMSSVMSIAIEKDSMGSGSASYTITGTLASSAVQSGGGTLTGSFDVEVSYQ